jgi:hypothetical protein
MHPKFLYPKQANSNPNAYNSEAGEKIEFHFIPGMPLPQFLMPPRVRRGCVARNRRHQGGVRRPDRDLPCLGRRQRATTAKRFPDQPPAGSLRLRPRTGHPPQRTRHRGSCVQDAPLHGAGLRHPSADLHRRKNHQPDVFEFSARQHRRARARHRSSGSALPTLKAARAKMIMEMHGPRRCSVTRMTPRRNAVCSGCSKSAASKTRPTFSSATRTSRDWKISTSRRTSPRTADAVGEPPDSLRVPHRPAQVPEIKQWTPEQRDELVRHVILHAQVHQSAERAHARAAVRLPRPGCADHAA